MKRITAIITVSSFVLLAASTARASLGQFAGPLVNGVEHGAISIGSSGGETWIISDASVPGDSSNFFIYRWNGSGWTVQPNAAAQITVSAGGIPWVLRADGSIWKWTGSSFTQPNGIGSYQGGSSCAKEIAVGFNDDAWITSCGSAADTAIFRWTGSQWAVPSQGGSARHVGMFINVSFATPWAVQSGGSIYKWTTGGWVGEGSGAISISDHNVIAQNACWLWDDNTSSWSSNAAAPSGKTLWKLAGAWALTTDHAIYNTVRP